MDRPQPYDSGIKGLNLYLTGAVPVFAYVKLLLDIAAVLGLSYYAAHLIVDLLLLGEQRRQLVLVLQQAACIALCFFLLVMCLHSVGEKLGRGEQQRQTGWDKRRSRHKHRLERVIRLEVIPE